MIPAVLHIERVWELPPALALATRKWVGYWLAGGQLDLRMVKPHG